MCHVRSLMTLSCTSCGCRKNLSRFLVTISHQRDAGPCSTRVQRLLALWTKLKFPRKILGSKISGCATIIECFWRTKPKIFFVNESQIFIPAQMVLLSRMCGDFYVTNCKPKRSRIFYIDKSLGM